MTQREAIDYLRGSWNAAENEYGPSGVSFEECVKALGVTDVELNTKGTCPVCGVVVATFLYTDNLLHCVGHSSHSSLGGVIYCPGSATVCQEDASCSRRS